ncbi:acyl-CoA--sterol O-acyltransferase 1-like [Punica granatum]|uniref:Wax synthase domain-containing protein n=2 Tax=Punica granatum TaxID=22663 RepID=A0A218XL59_PUNGR|nr:acyl-CoA--sterol O-acyltransferase 1-like [Punica granatum]OWM85614.1 hypothetical protein CDL15_Pgr029037 [Punica granatum]PKI69190.1 hypothetical protein CRG98_010395 [Punica granatum]
MEGVIYNFFKVWASVVASLGYCYTIGKFVPKGIARLLLVLPIVRLFFLLPLSIDSVNLSGMTGFFVAWLANFKLLLFAFGKGPLATEDSLGSLPHFITVACLPIKVQQKQSQNGCKDKGTGEMKHQKGHRSSLNYALKVVVLVAMIRVYYYSDRIHPTIIYLLYCIHIYFSLEITQASLAAVVQATLGIELEPQFNEPYLSTSLQDFWGRRWNLMVTSILRPSVYEPVRKALEQIIGQQWAPLPAVLATFLVSGLMHEVLFFYQQESAQRAGPTWDITGFFLFHGMCLVAELMAKKVVARRWQPPRLLSGAVTSGFVIATGLRWFIPALLRIEADKRALEEFGAVAAFVQDSAQAVSVKIFNAVIV